MTSINFRAATEADLPIIIEMLVDDALGSKREAKDIKVTAKYSEAFKEITNDKNSQLIVAENEGEVVGTMHLTFIQYLTYKGGKRALIEAVRIASSYRGQGLGKEMINHAISMARENNCHMVQLTTNKARKDAIKFYESLGFEATHKGMKLMLS